MKKRKQKLLVRASALLLSLTTVTAIVLLCGCNNKKDGTETTDAATNATTNAETTAAETNEETTVSESTAAPATDKPCRMTVPNFHGHLRTKCWC